MSTITTINSTDLITNSRSTINTNFSNLNTDKIETSYLDTDTTLAANSDSKIATQKAVKTYIDSSGGANASTTVRGIVEEATSAEMIAGTAAGGTGARLFLNPSLVAETGADKIVKTKSTGLLDSSIVPVSTALTFLPAPVYGLTSLTPTETNINSNTTMWIALFNIPQKITVNKISIRTRLEGVSGTYDLTMYSEDGQTQLFSVTTATTGGNDKLLTTSVSAVVLNPGNYWLGVNPNSTATTTMYCYTCAALPFVGATDLVNDVSSEPVLQGTVTITAGTPPSTITPTSVTAVNSSGLIFRLDN